MNFLEYIQYNDLSHIYQEQFRIDNNRSFMVQSFLESDVSDYDNSAE